VVHQLGASDLEFDDFFSLRRPKVTCRPASRCFVPAPPAPSTQLFGLQASALRLADVVPTSQHVFAGLSSGLQSAAKGGGSGAACLVGVPAVGAYAVRSLPRRTALALAYSGGRAASAASWAV
jgi:hypothetical protein